MCVFTLRCDVSDFSRQVEQIGKLAVTKIVILLSYTTFNDLQNFVELPRFTMLLFNIIICSIFKYHTKKAHKETTLNKKKVRGLIKLSFHWLVETLPELKNTKL